MTEDRGVGRVRIGRVDANASDVVRVLEAELGFTVDRVEVTTPEAAEECGFRGSPSVHVDGVDIFAEQESPVGLSCRIYQTPNGPAGSPTLESLRAVLSAL